MPNRTRGAATLALVLALADQGAGALGPTYGGALDVGLDALPARFDPSAARGAGPRLISALVHETLVTVAPDGAVAPALAAEWSSAPGGREWTIRLRPDAVFHDGAAISSADALRSLRRFVRSPSPAGAWLSRHITGGAAYRARTTEDMAGLVALDPSRVVLRLDDPVEGVLASLAAPAAALTSARGAGAGPFVPTTNAPVQGRVALVQFARHVRGRPFLDAVTLVTGNGDVVPAVGPGPLAATLLLVIDPRGPLAGVEARRALAAAIDGDDLVRHFLPGATAAQSLLPPSLLPAAPAPPRLPHDSGGGGVLGLSVSTDVPIAVSQRVAAQMGGAGFQVAAVPLSPEDVWTASLTNARLAVWTPEVADPLLALEELAALAPAAATAATRDLLRRAARETDGDRRDALLLRADAALRATAILVPIAVVPVGFRARAGVEGVIVDGAGRIRLEDAWIAR